jgi:AcrR family transcriptional regulator
MLIEVTANQVDTGAQAPPKGALNDARRSEILKAAEEAFAEKGYEATTVEDIALRVGLLKGSLYYYIQNKADLYYQVAARSTEQHLRALKEDPGVIAGDPVSRLLRYVEMYMSELNNTWRWSRILTEYELARAGNDAIAKVKALRYQIHLILKGILVQGVADGVFDPTFDPSVASNSILSMMNDTRRWFRPTGRKSAEEIVEFYQQFVLKGVSLR